MNRPDLARAAIADAAAVVRGRITTRTIDLPEHRLVHVVFAPGARWSIDAAPSAGTALCQRPHDAIVLSGTLGVRIAGNTAELIPADHVFHLPAGHDAWCVGIEPCVLLEIEPAVRP